MRICYNNHKGYVLLLTLLIVGSITIVITLSFLLISVGNTKSSLSLEQANQAKGLANACVEDALQQINGNHSFSGYTSLNFGQGSCSYEVEFGSGDIRNITASSTVDNIVRKIYVIVDQLSPQVNISSWQEIE